MHLFKYNNSIKTQPTTPVIKLFFMTLYMYIHTYVCLSVSMHLQAFLFLKKKKTKIKKEKKIRKLQSIKPDYLPIYRHGVNKIVFFIIFLKILILIKFSK